MSQKAIQIVFLDVGQGDSTLIVLPDLTSAILIDCPSKRITLDYLEAERITRLSHVFVSHSDDDHLGGIDALLTNFLRAGNAVDVLSYNHDTPRISDGRRNAQLRHLLQLSERYSINITSPKTGDTWTEQSVIIEILHPSDSNLKKAQLNNSINNASALIRITYGGRRALFTGDLQAWGWQMIMLQGTDLRADILKFPHHGAWYSVSSSQPSLADVLNAIVPNWVVVSAGNGNKYGHPHPNTMALLSSQAHIQFAYTEPPEGCKSTISTKRGPFACGGNVKIAVDDTSNITIL